MTKIQLFTATWCGQCTALKKQLEQKGVEFTQVDVDSVTGGELATKWSVRGLPAAIIDDELISGLGNILGKVSKEV